MIWAMENDATEHVVVKAVEPGVIRPIRQRVLRPHQPIEAMVYPGDEAGGTFHLAALDKAGHVLGIASFYKDEHPLQARPGDRRLRGMAVEPAWQGRGLGSRLVRAGINHIKEEGGSRLWCNARVSAQPFYEKLGFIAEGEEFHIEHIGPHYVMTTNIAV